MRYLLIAVLSLLASNALSQVAFEQGGAAQIVNNGDTLSNAFIGGFNNPIFSNLDFNQDGFQDLYVFDHADNTQYLYEHIGIADSLAFIPRPDLVANLPDTLMNFWAKLVDYDRDGDMDIFAGVPGGVVLHKNLTQETGDFSFAIGTQKIKTSYFGFESALYVASVDIPAIVDVDGDGDIDVLTYDVTGQRVEWHENMQADSGWATDSMRCTMASECWGHFRELYDITTNYYDVSLNLPACDVPIPKTTHIGGAILGLNLNADTLMDIVVSDVDVGYMIALQNAGATNYAHIDTAFLHFPNPSPMLMNVFPAGSHVDLNGDDIRDLILAPHQRDNNNDFSAVWRYKNQGADDDPDFEIMETAFLQDQMLDLGTMTMPYAQDFNGDGLKDLVLVVGERFVADSAAKTGQFYYFENIGDSTHAVFDYDPMPVLGYVTDTLGGSVFPRFAMADLDSDGLSDLFLFYSNFGLLHLEATTNGSGFPTFTQLSSTLPDLQSNNIRQGHPEFYDVDGDSDYDLLIATRSGKIAYYENIGDSTAFDFKFVTDNYGNVDVSPANGHHTLRIRTLANDSLPSMVIGTPKGQLVRLDSISANDTAQRTFTELVPGGWFGRSPSLEVLHTRVDTDSVRVNYVLGQWLGGAKLYSQVIFDAYNPLADTDTLISNLPEQLPRMRVYPNPVTDALTLELESPGNIRIEAVNGKAILRDGFDAGTHELQLGNLPAGMYILRYTHRQTEETQKLIVR